MSSQLQEYLTKKMSMTEVYQPVIIKELLLRGGECSTSDLALVIARYDLSVLDYYQKIVMRYPRQTLTRHGIIRYQPDGKLFKFIPSIVDVENADLEIETCDTQIALWQERKRNRERSPQVNESVRYSVLKRAKGKCESCGIPAFNRPIDVDHIVPQSLADKYGKVWKDGALIEVHSERNLQALCYKCNRAKRDSDSTDFRRTGTLVRGKSSESLETVTADTVQRLRGSQLREALHEKLFEELEKNAEGKIVHTPDKPADMLEVIFTIANVQGLNQNELLRMVSDKRNAQGGFEQGYFQLNTVRARA